MATTQKLFMDAIDKYCREANKFMKKLALQMGQPDDLEQALRIVRSVFHTLRDRIAPEESMHLVSQLPMILKGIYVDGWKMSQQSGSKSLEDFLCDLRASDMAAGYDFANDEAAQQKVRAVFSALRQYIDDGELRHIIDGLPTEIANIIAA